MRKIAICDDEASHRERIAQLVRGLKPAAELRLFCAPIAFLSAVQTEGYTPDAAIVDIQMDGMSGIELAERLNRRFRNAPLFSSRPTLALQQTFTTRSTSISF